LRRDLTGGEAEACAIGLTAVCQLCRFGRDGLGHRRAQRSLHRSVPALPLADAATRRQS